MALLEISETTMKRLRAIAEKRQQSVEAVVEDLVARHLSEEMGIEGDQAAVKDAWRKLVGLGSSGHTETASKIREVMEELTYPHRSWSLKDTKSGPEGAR